MCGFLGALSFDVPIQKYVARLAAGLSAIRHRGPDHSSQLADERAYLGHNRLSIIDLTEAAHQPLKSASAEAWIVYNGEIYNFRELKDSLKDKVPFATRSDTEVLLQGYLTEGVDFFGRLRGIYAFAILDKRAGTSLILGRDPAGIKPLYYFRDRELLVFGSEIKSLVPVVRERLSIHHDVIKAYLNLGYCPEPYTAYREIRALSPGCVVSAHGQVWEQSSFAKYVFTNENRLSFEENAERTAALIDGAVARNLVADVEVAVALSGGIDSSLIYACAARQNSGIRALTVRFGDRDYDETPLARLYTKHLSGTHQLLDVEGDFSLELLDRLLLHFDQPYADSSAVPMYYLSRCTKQYTKVLLGGDGGDELFNGYASQAQLPTAAKVRQLGLGSVLRSFLTVAARFTNVETSRTLARAQTLLVAEPEDMLFDWLSWFPRHTRLNGRSPFLYPQEQGLGLYRQVFAEDTPADFRQRLAFEHFTKMLLSDYLRKTDMMSMLNGVEYRVPLLDEDLVRFALTVPFHQKSSLLRTKKLPRHLHQRVFPAHTSRAPKRGFSIPLDVHLARRDIDKMRDLVLRSQSFVASLIRKDYLRFVFDLATGARQDPLHISRAGIYQRALLFYSLELWHEHHVANYRSNVGAVNVETQWPSQPQAVATLRSHYHIRPSLN